MNDVGITAEQVRTAIFNSSSYASYDGTKYYADGISMQAIADELNATERVRCTHAYETYQELHGTDCPAWKCGHCGELFENDGKYCTQCGYKIIEVLPPIDRL